MGAYFLDTLYSDIETLLLHAGIHTRHFGYFRSLSKRFPYATYYKLSGEDIEIWRVYRLMLCAPSVLDNTCIAII